MSANQSYILQCSLIRNKTNHFVNQNDDDDASNLLNIFCFQILSRKTDPNLSVYFYF